MTQTHTGTTNWTAINLSGLTQTGGVELCCLAANTGLVYYSDQSAAPTDLGPSFPVRLDNPAGVFIPASQFQGGNAANKLWVKLSVSGDNLGIRVY